MYPKFETRGDLIECVSRFRDWSVLPSPMFLRYKLTPLSRRLQEKVIDIEVANKTPSPTVDPSVRTILIGHSMGGIVAADTVLALATEQAIDAEEPALNSNMFPYIQGVLAFDTPYLGISPGVVAHGAEGHYNAASSALTQLSGLTGRCGVGRRRVRMRTRRRERNRLPR